MVGSFGGVCRDLHRDVTSKRRILSHGQLAPLTDPGISIPDLDLPMDERTNTRYSVVEFTGRWYRCSCVRNGERYFNSVTET